MSPPRVEIPAGRAVPADEELTAHLDADPDHDGPDQRVDHSPSRAPSDSTAVRAAVSMWCARTRRPLMLIEECPSRSATALICTPDSSHATAALCRSVCTPMSSIPAERAAVSTTRSGLRGSTGVPSSVVNTSPQTAIGHPRAVVRLPGLPCGTSALP